MMQLENTTSLFHHRSNVRETRWSCLLLLSGRVFWIQPDCHRTRGPRKDHIHLSIWNICIQTNVVWFMQCTCNLPAVRDGDILKYSREVYGDLYGRFHDYGRCI